MKVDEILSNVQVSFYASPSRLIPLELSLSFSVVYTFEDQSMLQLL